MQSIVGKEQPSVGDSLEQRSARARWRSRRGMLELDFFLVGFAEQVFPGLSVAQQQVYAELLACEDVDIHAWLTLQSQPEEPEFQELVARIRAHASQPPD